MNEDQFSSTSLAKSSKGLSMEDNFDLSMFGVWGQKDLATVAQGQTSGIRVTGGTAKPVGQISMGTVTPVAPSGPKPTLGTMPAFTAPERDKGRIEELTQENMFPIRPLRRELRRIILEAGRSENPMVAKAKIGEALTSFGDSLSQIAGRARQEGRRDYETEYGYKYSGAQTQFQTDVAAKMAEFNASLADYARRYGQKSTTMTRNIYPETEEIKFPKVL